MLIKEDIDILCISESWLDSEIESPFFDIGNYSLFRCDGMKSRGSGSCIYAKTILKPQQIFPSDESVGKGVKVEMVWLKLQLKSLKSFIVGSIYKHPRSDCKIAALDFIEKTFQNVNVMKNSFYAFGDFNEDLLIENNKLTKIINRLCLTQLVQQETRITNKSGTLIDLAITNAPNSVLDIDVSPSVADHHEIKCTINLLKEKFKPIEITCRNMRLYSPENFVTALSSNFPDFHRIYNTDDVNKQVAIFTTGVDQALDQCAPMRTITMKRQPVKWFSEEMRRNGQLLEQQRRTWKNNPQNMAERKKYQRMKKDHKKEIADARRNSIHADLRESRGNPKRTWDIMRNTVQYKKPHESTNNIEDPLATATNFNAFFAQVGQKVYTEVSGGSTNVSPISCDTQNECSQEMLWKPKPAALKDVRQIIFSMKNTKATGHDNLSLKFIKDGFFVIGPLLLCIINTSIATNTFPDTWKHSIIKPLLKSGDEQLPSNYRPISLLPVCSKILEKVIANQLSKFLESRNVFHKNQYAYRSGLGTQDALLNINETVYREMDNSNLTLLILLDLSKAFDSVHHQILIRKIRKLRVDPRWFESYLSNRKHAVSLQGSVSPLLTNNFGVPQGSILGPLLFLIFVNDIPSMPSDITMSMYADDVQLAIPFPPEQEDETRSRAEAILYELKNWYDLNGLKLNSSKTQCMTLGTPFRTSKLTDFYICFEGTIIKPIDQVKNLGIRYDKNMSFNDHIDYMRKKTYGPLLYMNKFKHLLDKTARLHLTQSLVFTHFNYCPLIWSRTKKGNIEKLQKSQNFAAKVVLNGKFLKSDRATPLLKKLQWPEIDHQLFVSEAKFVHSSLNIDRSNAQLINFTLSSSINNRASRNINLVTQFRGTDHGKQALSVSGAHLWNNLPNNIRSIESRNIFAAKVLQHRAAQGA